MKVIELNNKFDRQYSNNGQHAEQVFKFTMTGELVKADNKPAELCGDYLDIQIKSQKATVCKGSNLKAYLDLDAAERYAYVNADFSKAYVMSRDEWERFVGEFGYLTTGSSKEKHIAKIRLKSESKKMVEWLEKN